MSELSQAWDYIEQMRQKGYHIRVAWNTYAKEMSVVFIEGGKPRKDRRQWCGLGLTLYGAVQEAIAKWQWRLSKESTDD